MNILAAYCILSILEKLGVLAFLTLPLLVLMATRKFRRTLGWESCDSWCQDHMEPLNVNIITTSLNHSFSKYLSACSVWGTVLSTKKIVVYKTDLVSALCEQIIFWKTVLDSQGEFKNFFCMFLFIIIKRQIYISISLYNSSLVPLIYQATG